MKQRTKYDVFSTDMAVPPTVLVLQYLFNFRLQQKYYFFILNFFLDWLEH